jgi:16S rRNA processing protein RimM
MARQAQETVIGQITSVFGVKGWLKVYSYTDPREGILDYRNWTLVHNGQRLPVKVEEGRRQGQSVVVSLKGVGDRDIARSYCGSDITVPTQDLPDLPEGEYYWHELEGLTVVTTENECLGCVDHLIETGSNDVLVVHATDLSIDQRERLIPYLPDQVVRMVSLDEAKMIVEWDPEF